MFQDGKRRLSPQPLMARGEDDMSSARTSEVCTTIVLLLTDILEKQSEQLHVQKAQLSVLESKVKDKMFFCPASTVPQEQLCPEDKSLMHEATSTLPGAKSANREEHRNGVGGIFEDETQVLQEFGKVLEHPTETLDYVTEPSFHLTEPSCPRVDLAVTASELQRSSSLSEESLADILATPSHKSSPNPRETIRSLRSQKSVFPKSHAKVFKLLVFAGVLGDKSVHHRGCYITYRRFLLLAEFLHCTFHVKSLVMQATGYGGHSTVAAFMVFIQLAMAHPLWQAWNNEFKRTGPTFQLLQQMDSRGFPWTNLKGSIRCCLALSMFLSACCVIFWFWVLSTGTSYTQLLFRDQKSRYDKVIFWISASIDSCALPSQALWVCIAPVHVWIVYFVARLHVHDLHCYAAAFDKAMSNIDPAVDVVPAQVVVTARLRLASARWVPRVVFYMVCLCVIGLILCMFLMTVEKLSAQQLFMYAVLSLFASIFITALCGPLSMVAEAFEYDVRRALNNPVTLNKAQRYVGQQLLAHLQHLNWGFRLGGCTITAQMVSNIAVGVVLTMVTSVSRAAFEQASFEV